VEDAAKHVADVSLLRRKQELQKRTNFRETVSESFGYAYYWGIVFEDFLSSLNLMLQGHGRNLRPYSVASSLQSSVVRRKTLQVLSCLHSPGFAVRVAELYCFYMTLKHVIW
jgi:hypothetical protein